MVAITIKGTGQLTSHWQQQKAEDSHSSYQSRTFDLPIY